MNFDKSKPFGTIWGGVMHGRLFQSGQVFDHDGNHLGDGSDPSTPAAQDPVAAPVDAGAGMVALAQAQALEQAAAHGDLLLKAVGLVEQATDKVIAELEDVPDAMLDFIHKVESAGKQRAAVLAAILQAKGSRAMQAEKDAQANGLTASQAGLAPAGNDQLAAQLGS